MCGIAGVISDENVTGVKSRLEKMARSLVHRGPDDEGFWTGRTGGLQVGLAHRRLSILDLSAAGHQPMISPCQKHILIYNGEIFNFQELRAELEGKGIVFRSHSDTEVVLQALIHWGDEAFARFNGMWALCWFDVERKRICLSRDRFGIKPLYYHKQGNAFFFASEIKAILTGVSKKFEINTHVAGRFLKQSLLDTQNETFFKDIECLPAGQNIYISLENGFKVSPPASYWTIASSDEMAQLSEKQIIEDIRETFFDSVKLRLRSDVPTGLMLSGGLDSSAISVVMRQIYGPNVDLHLLSVVGDEPRFHEQSHIDIMTRHLNCPTNTIPLRHNPEQYFKLMEEVTWFNDEPVISFSTAASYLLMQRAKELGIKVILNGQGADEILCGYKKYLFFYLQSLLRSGQVGKSLKVFGKFLRKSTILGQFSLSEAKRYLPIRLKKTGIDVLGPHLQNTNSHLPMGIGEGTVSERQLKDLYQFSTPTILHIEDRISMALSRETRHPFLDHRFVQKLINLPTHFKIRDGWTKWIFRKAMEPYLPKEITWRQDKQGFVIPEIHWLKNDFKGHISSLLKGDMNSRELGLINAENLQKKYDIYSRQPKETGYISHKDIINPIALELWCRRFEGYLRSPA